MNRHASALAAVLFLAAAEFAHCDAPGASSFSPATDGQQALAAMLSRLIENAIPLEYDKQKDWGATKEIPTGLRVEGHGFDVRLKKRKRAVNHGVWKHYKLRLVEPEQNLAIQLVALRPLTPGRMAFTLHGAARIDAWARAKVYQYGVHLIALETESDMRVRLAIDGEFGVQAGGSGAATTLAFVPVITAAQLSIDEFHLRRVSNADGPIVHELGDGVRRLVEEELNGPRLVEKLNRAIDKKRDRLTFQPVEVLQAKWPFAAWPATPVVPAAPTAGSVSDAEHGAPR